MVQLEELGVGKTMIYDDSYDMIVQARKAAKSDHLKQQALSSDSSSCTFTLPLLTIHVETRELCEDIKGDVVSVKCKWTFLS